MAKKKTIKHFIDNLSLYKITDADDGSLKGHYIIIDDEGDFEIFEKKRGLAVKYLDNPLRVQKDRLQYLVALVDMHMEKNRLCVKFRGCDEVLFVRECKLKTIPAEFARCHRLRRNLVRRMPNTKGRKIRRSCGLFYEDSYGYFIIYRHRKVRQSNRQT